VIVAVGSVRGAPGVSVSAVLLAAAWPGGAERVVVEADLDGGVIGARYGVGVEPGVGALVSALRHDVTDERLLERSGRCVATGAWLVPGPESAISALRVWGSDRAAHQVAEALAADGERVWLIDAGRVSSRSVTAPLVARADVTLLFSRDQPPDLLQIPERAADLGALCAHVGVVVVGTPDYGVDELRAFCGVEHLWRVAPEPDAVALTQRGWGDRRLRRAPLWRDMVGLASDLADMGAIRTTPAGGLDA
jgi:MinD-like ATPase involved in chromosome partitioning or flagellar assembly